VPLIRATHASKGSARQGIDVGVVALSSSSKLDQETLDVLRDLERFDVPAVLVATISSKRRLPRRRWNDNQLVRECESVLGYKPAVFHVDYDSLLRDGDDPSVDAIVDYATELAARTSSQIEADQSVQRSTGPSEFFPFMVEPDALRSLMRRNIRQEIEKAKSSGRQLAVWRDGQVVYVQGDEIDTTPAQVEGSSGLDIRTAPEMPTRPDGAK
jgi:hypothetical protein